MAKGRRSKITHKKHAKKGRVSSRRKKGGYLFYPGPGDEESFFTKLNPFKRKEQVVEEEVVDAQEITPSELPASDSTTTPEPEPQPEEQPASEPSATEEVVEEKEEEEKETMSGGKKKRKGKRSRKSKKKSKKQKGGKKKRKTKKRAYKKRK